MLNSTLRTVTAYLGDSKTWAVTIRYRSSGVGLPLTGHTLSWLVSASLDSAALLQKDVTDHTDPANGISYLTLTAADLETIGGVGNYYLTGIEVDEAGNEVTRALSRLKVASRPQRSP